MKPDYVDALVVTALQLERRAVREHLADIETTQDRAAATDIGDFEGIEGTIRVGIIEVGAGNIDAATLTTSIATALQPKVVLMVGIAGGIKDLRIGDVVASSKIYWAEPGKSEIDRVSPRPDFGPVSIELVQAARSVAADDSWQSRIRGRRAEEMTPRALVAPIVAGERVVVSTKSEDAKRIHKTFGDAVAVAMEDVGVMRAAAVAGAQGIAIRAASDLLDDKAASDAAGSQHTAAANAAAFACELLARLALAKPAGNDESLYDVVSDLYSQGPNDRSIWDRSGGDPSRIQAGGTGRSMWWAALRDLDRGGGGQGITVQRLVSTMLDDYPANSELLRLQRPASG